MGDRITSLYLIFEEGLVEKNREKLNEVLSEDFVLVHMSGMRQTKKEYIDSVMDGTMNYYSAIHDSISVHKIDETSARLRGRSRTNAAVFGGSRHTWRLQLDFLVKMIKGEWKLTQAVASVY